MSFNLLINFNWDVEILQQLKEYHAPHMQLRLIWWHSRPCDELLGTHVTAAGFIFVVVTMADQALYISRIKGHYGF